MVLEKFRIFKNKHYSRTESDKNLYPCDHDENQNTEHFYHPQKFTCALGPNSCQATIDLHSVTSFA